MSGAPRSQPAITVSARYRNKSGRPPQAERGDNLKAGEQSPAFLPVGFLSCFESSLGDPLTKNVTSDAGAYREAAAKQPTVKFATYRQGLTRGTKEPGSAIKVLEVLMHTQPGLFSGIEALCYERVGFLSSNC